MVPLVLVFRMSASKWPLLAGDQGINFPDNYTDAVDNRFFVDSVVFTLKYTILATILLIALGLGLALHGAGVVALEGASCARRSWCRARSAWRRRRCSSTSCTRRWPARWRPSWSAWAGASSARPNAALASTLFLIVWRYAGFYMLLMLVGLQAIPGDIYEAARMDGASRWHTFRRITIPLLQPTLALTTILCVTGSLLAFEQFYILTKGGPDNSTITVVQLIYSVAFQGQNDLGVAAALSVHRAGRARRHQRRPAPRLPRLGRELRGRR